MASYGTKKGIVKAIASDDRNSLRSYLRELVQEDGPLRTERLLATMSMHNPELTPDGFQVALKVFDEEQRANLRSLKRRFPDSWQLR
jgi:hypothetical protein